MSVTIIDYSPEVLKTKNAAVAKALEMMGLQAEGYAKTYCPVDTGRLRSSITHMQEDKDTEIIATNVEYAPYVEYGTIRMKAQPYFKPAVANHVSEYKRIAEDALKGLI